ncbi:DEAD/DEAH box helicase [Citricoccus sp. SGAir0253]|uniref:DEAD/DEAH box helicase n=1 Tax=Citricoccus sp. SGAir0253 TaxID=2567881 RepID=UPI0010CD62C9|nr:DEAD/DEAH box helicase [Citricoccus sp. SGAir0253]QCU77707.1 DEAD/DEAH box helicase [Citricoccus sp. SGAir0253]
MTPEQKIAADNDVDTEDLSTAAIETVDVEDSIDIHEANAPQPEKTFADFAVRADMVEALAEKGITHPFPIQAMTLPVALSGHDIIGQAKTGTGKTLGFGLPLLQRVVGPDEEGFDRLSAPGAPQALVVAPTRELANQVAADITAAASKRSVRIATIYGGRAYEPQIEELQRGVEVVVGTPGRLIDLMRQRHLNLKLVKIVVLDEADEMLDLGFLPDVETLLSAVPEVRQTMLFSATMPGPVVAMARRYMTQPTHIRAADPEDEGITKKDIRQLVYRAHHMDKDELVARALQAEGRGKTIIFTRTKRTAARLSDELEKRGFAAGAIHGDLGQGAREQALRAFRGDKIDVLVATDVAARGIDVDDVTHVINFQCPEDEKTYLHRVGRTGRAGNKGTAVTLVDWEDMPRWTLINKALGMDVPEPAETYSSSKHLFADLGIPKGTKGRLPKVRRTKAGLDAEVLEDLGGPGAPRGGRERGRGGRDGGRDGGREGGRGGRDGGRGGRGSGDAGREGSEGGRGRSRGRGRDAGRDGAGREGAAAGGATRGGAEGAAGEGRRRDGAAAEGAGEGRERSARRRSRTRTRRRTGEAAPGGGSGAAPASGD